MPDDVYNPLDKSRLAESVAHALLETEPVRLAATAMFEGAGIYAIYYGGSFDPYLPVRASAQGSGSPIYVGKAIPKGGRKGGWGLGLNPGSVLAARLRQHAKSVRECENLDLDDFSCRYLVVDDVWIPLAESLLIEWFAPIWNVVLDGFGNHDPGRGRAAGRRPAWDTVHPGREWAARLPANTRSASDWIDLVRRSVTGDVSARIIDAQDAVMNEESDFD